LGHSGIEFLSPWRELECGGPRDIFQSSCGALNRGLHLFAWRPRLARSARILDTQATPHIPNSFNPFNLSRLPHYPPAASCMHAPKMPDSALWPFLRTMRETKPRVLPTPLSKKQQTIPGYYGYNIPHRPAIKAGKCPRLDTGGEIENLPPPPHIELGIWNLETPWAFSLLAECGLVGGYCMSECGEHPEIPLVEMRRYLGLSEHQTFGR